MYYFVEYLRRVMEAYDIISRAYPETREGGLLAGVLLSEVGDFIRELAPRLVLDVGAGAGGNLEVLRKFLGNSMYIGCELSIGMIRASGEGIEWINCSSTHIPIRTESLDLVVSIAVLHHIPKNLIMDALREIRRVLRVGGAFITTVWGCEGEVLRRLRKLSDCEGYLPWSYGLDREVLRFYRLYRKGELEGEVINVGLNVIKNGVIRIGGFINYYVVSRK
jgi:SAM-dependent methyltransferase